MHAEKIANLQALIWILSHQPATIDGLAKALKVRPRTVYRLIDEARAAHYNVVSRRVRGARHSEFFIVKSKG
jgi:predicted DNA-binding transcriptional regulator YafY